MFERRLVNHGPGEILQPTVTVVSNTVWQVLYPFSLACAILCLGCVCNFFLCFFINTGLIVLIAIYACFSPQGQRTVVLTRLASLHNDSYFNSPLAPTNFPLDFINAIGNQASISYIYLFFLTRRFFFCLAPHLFKCHRQFSHYFLHRYIELFNQFVEINKYARHYFLYCVTCYFSNVRYHRQRTASRLTLLSTAAPACLCQPAQRTYLQVNDL